MSMFFSERSPGKPKEEKSQGYIPLVDSEELAITVQPSEDFSDRLRRIKRQVTKTSAITSFCRTLGLKDLGAVLLEGGLWTGAVLLGNLLHKMGNRIKDTQWDYEHQPQLILGNQTCGEAATASIDELCRGASRTDDFREACDDLLYGSCDDLQGISFAVAAMSFFAVVLFVHIAKEKSRKLKDPFLHLNPEDIEFLFTNKIFSERDRPITRSDVIKQLDKSLIHDQLHKKFHNLMVDEGELGPVGQNIVEFLDVEDSQAFRQALAIKLTL